MKGIIYHYLTDKGFGFIKDENEDKRFFHINNLREKEKFLTNVEDYFYTDYIERICYVVTFTPRENEKGLLATNINLTDQIFNHKLLGSEFEANIVDIKYEVNSLTRICSGFSKGMGAPLGATAGGNGTYRIGYPEFLRELYLYFRRTDEIGWGAIEVRELVLKINGRSQITPKLVDTLKKQLVGKVTSIHLKNNEWTLRDTSVLKI